MQRGARTLTQTTLLISGLLYVLLRGLALAFDSGFLRTLSKLALACLVLVALIWAFRALWRSFFWRVGRRLAFSYFAVGVLPMAMLALIFLLTAYMFGGFLLGHLYRDALDDLEAELRSAAEIRVADLVHRKPGLPDRIGELAFVEYRADRRLSGDPEAPLQWPQWLERAAAPGASVDAAANSPAGIDGRFVGRIAG